LYVATRITWFDRGRRRRLGWAESAAHRKKKKGGAKKFRAASTASIKPNATDTGNR
jgi:hypothetical protein